MNRNDADRLGLIGILIGMSCVIIIVITSALWIVATFILRDEGFALFSFILGPPLGAVVSAFTSYLAYSKYRNRA